MYWQKTILFMIVLVGLISCGGPQSIRENTHAKQHSQKATVEGVIEDMHKRTVTYDWFAAKGKAKIESPEENVRGLFYIRMQKDSCIWMLFKKNSVEASRILIRPDSFFVIYRLDQQYKKGPMSEIENELNIDFSFSDAQEMMAGNTLLPEADKARLIEEEKSYRMEVEEMDLFLTYWLGKSQWLVNRALYQDKTGRQVNMIFSDYKKVMDNSKIPYIREYEFPLEEDQKAYFKLEFTKIAFDKTTIPSFSIPSHYQQVD